MIQLCRAEDGVVVQLDISLWDLERYTSPYTSYECKASQQADWIAWTTLYMRTQGSRQKLYGRTSLTEGHSRLTTSVSSQDWRIKYVSWIRCAVDVLTTC